MNRLRELDFLRGIAILFVLTRHQLFFSSLMRMGWIGVDLFFVLSGFLISGLLFREYQKHGNIQPKRFLIRRGFKIYPIYYLFYLPYLIPIFSAGTFDFRSFLADMTFTQNYVLGWGYANVPSWTLAIEEHFYFGFAIILWLALKNGKSIFANYSNVVRISPFEITVISIMILCPIMRIISNQLFPWSFTKNIAMTHLRIDSLLGGVLVSFLYHFRLESTTKMFNKYKWILLFVALLGLSWTPFIEPVPSLFVKRFGFTILYISFGIILLFFALTDDINKKLNSIFTPLAVDVVSKIGFCSYSIYIIHTIVNICNSEVLLRFNIPYNRYLTFLITSLISIMLGMIITYKVESYFLKVRNKYFPSRT
jgi:peptidoglycan/LPS O-acetylase OafA/YrhL